MSERKICYITGTRADYGLMRSTLLKIKEEFSLTLIITGMHLCPEYGYSLTDIRKDGFEHYYTVDMLLANDSAAAMAKSLGLAIIGITQTLESVKPDILLVTGDRGEALAGTLAAAHLNIPVAHIHGGDQGDDGAHIDDPIRHSITKFAHIHLAATQKSADRLLKMGEEPWRIHLVGSPAVDDLLSDDFYSRDFLEKKYGLDLSRPFILAIQHPSLTQIDQAEKQITETLEALREINLQTILIYPNSDAGGRKMIKIIEKYEKYDFLKTFKNLPRKDYLSLMKLASVMVGNSSSGTIDAPIFRLPVVNVGTRESVRENAGNKIFVTNDRKEITGAIKKALSDKKFLAHVEKCRSPYGNGKAGEKIVKVLKKVKLDNKLLEKHLTY
ncbi:UDP-N-acetylglucosamine 2-epimerase [Methanoregula sp.]|jgi:GDP/UDP-N,N'-diacetylbacillosamine 2-epimerase (hydrolysing)|uniref:UDP-N-acetylglucosamine 2-epimerase n=1 Tax=Methanoregula sp. TaxID=2052170 RepID=UPI003C21F9BA